MNPDDYSLHYDLDHLILQVYDTLLRGRAPPVAVSHSAQRELFLSPEPEEKTIDVPRQKRNEVFFAVIEEAEAAIRSFSETLFELSLRTWMSCENASPWLIESAAIAAVRGPSALDDHSIQSVHRLRLACTRVDHEIHRLWGFTRFSLRSDSLYSSSLEPDNNVVAALLPHFAQRFPDQDFAIVDVRREIAYSVVAGKACGFDGQEALALLPDSVDGYEVDLWRRYFKAAENPARRNPGLQRKLMPVRYWKYMPELGATSIGSAGAENHRLRQPKLVNEQASDNCAKAIRPNLRKD